MNKINISTLGLLLLLIVTTLLSGCTGDTCIDADDFGFSKFTVSSRYKPEELGGTKKDNQSAPWRDSGLRVNGRPLMMVVKTWEYGIERNSSGQLSAWCPWYGTADDSAHLSDFCVRLQTCTFTSGIMCTRTADAQINNAPCILKNGVGLYALIAERGTDPNSTFQTQQSPEGVTIHLGEPVVGYNLFDIGQDGSIRRAGGIAYQYSGVDPVQYVNTPLYFKILDKFYDDNNGQYKVIIKSGVSNSRPDPIEYLTLLVKQNLFGRPADDDSNVRGGVQSADYGIIRNMYVGITNNSSYQRVVSIVLALYIAFSALSFLSGNLNITQGELIIRVIKVIIISMLLKSQYSWNFFNDYLFVFFVDGMAQILGIIQEAAQTGPGSASILGLMIAPQTMAKLFSLLFVDWMGFIYIILFLIALYFVFMMILEAAIIYLTALIAIGMIIIMGPIFLCFMLFQMTRSLFENWLKQLISYAMQPLILFAGLAFISIIIRTEIYSSLGFRVCKYSFPDLGPIGTIVTPKTDLDDSITNSIFYWWFPSPMKGEKFTKTQAIIPIPQDHFKSDGTFCPAYGCYENRYIELPFLHPVNDLDRLNNFFNGKFVQLDGLLLIFVCVYLLSKFNTLAVSVSKFLSSSSGNLTSLQGISSAAFLPIAKQINRPINAVVDRIERGRETISAFAAATYENNMMRSLERDALGSNANKAVTDEVARKYGLDVKDLKADSIKDYEKELKTRIKEAYKQNNNGAEISNKDLRKELNKSYDELKDKYDPNGDLRELAADAKFAKDFQKAYANAHQDMSARGVDIFGKNIQSIRNLQEMQNRVKEQENIKKAKRMQFAEGLYSGYEGIKRKVVTGLVGDELRDRLEGNLTGAAYHAYDYTDPRLRTYAEMLQDQDRAIREKELEARINRETIKAGVNILKPEYLAELEATGQREKLELYRALAREKIASDVYNALSQGENPALMGDKFMRKTATVEQLDEMIKRANAARSDIINNNMYIRREDKYEIAYDKANKQIIEEYDKAKNHFKLDNLTPEEMLPYIQQYYRQQNFMHSPPTTAYHERDYGEAGNSTVDAQAKLQAYQNAMKEANRAKEMMQRINDYKNQINMEVDKHIDTINSYKASRSNNPTRT